MLAWYYITIIAAVLMGAATIIEKYALKREHATAYTAAFTVLSAVAALPLIPFSNLNLPLSAWGLVYLISVLATIGYLLMAKVYRHGNISIASAITSSVPSLFVVLMGFAFLGEVLSPEQYMSIMVLVFAGYIFLARFNNGQADAKGHGIKFIDKLLGASFVIALGYILVKYLFNGGISPITYVLLSQLFVALNMLVYMVLKFGGLKEISSHIKANSKPLAAIAILTVAYRVPLYSSISLIQTSLAVPLLNGVFIIVTVMVGGLLFREGNIWKKILISAVLLAASYFLIL
ncbi:MAG: DMT family transporter [Candidatus Micrarchaeota archaeon]|nr:DMT family transporter [Candidatus Micrarchaeota archaeon]